MKITTVRTKLYRWNGPVKTEDTVFATPLSALPFQSDAQAPFRFFSWLVVEVETAEGLVGLGNAGLCPDITKQIVDTKTEAGLYTKVPLLLSVAPLRSFEEADYLAHEVPGVTIPDGVLKTLEKADRADVRAVGVDLAARLLEDARPLVNGVLLTAPDDDVTALVPLLSALK